MDDSDAKFITGNRRRIEITLEVLKKFLEASKLYCLVRDHPKEVSYSVILSGISCYGCGWRPTVKGMRLIHEVMRKNKGKDFPLTQLFKLYRDNLHKFYDERQIKPDILGSLDEDYIFYLMYERPKQSLRI